MKTIALKVSVLASALLLSTLLVRADDAAYARILQERESVLSQLVKSQESRLATGVSDEASLFAARLALASFKRDTAKSRAEKITQQEAIVGLHEKSLASLKSRATAGVVDSNEVLRATDAKLQAQQLLEELKLEAGKS